VEVALVDVAEDEKLRLARRLVTGQLDDLLALDRFVFLDDLLDVEVGRAVEAVVAELGIAEGADEDDRRLREILDERRALLLAAERAQDAGDAFGGRSRTGNDSGKRGLAE